MSRVIYSRKKINERMANNKRLTIIQARYLDFIKDYIKSNGFPPSVKDCADNFGVYVNAASDNLKALHNKGAIQIVPRISRGIRVLI